MGVFFALVTNVESVTKGGYLVVSGSIDELATALSGVNAPYKFISQYANADKEDFFREACELSKNNSLKLIYPNDDSLEGCYAISIPAGDRFGNYQELKNIASKLEGRIRTSKMMGSTDIMDKRYLNDSFQ